MKAADETTREPARIFRLLTGLIDLAGRYPRRVLVLALILAGASAYLASTRLQYRTQRDDLISPKKEYQKHWQRYVDEFGDDSDLVVVVQGRDRERMQQALEVLAGRVREQPSCFDHLFYKVDLRPLQNRALLFLTSQQIEQIRHNLQTMSMLLEPPLITGLDPLFGWKELTLTRLLREGRSRVAALHAGQPLSAADEQFLAQLAAIVCSAANTLDHPASYENPWRSLLVLSAGQADLIAQPQYFFSGDGSLAFLLTRPIREQGSFTGDRQSIEALRSIVANVSGSFPELQLGLTGIPVLENDEMVASQRDTAMASWLAIAGVGLLYLVVFRSVRYPLLIVATLAVGTAWALGWLTITVGHLNILSATFVVMLIGMGDYGVLWVTRYELNRRRGCDVRTALWHTARGGGPSILTAAAATACAFFAAMLADFQAVVELGWIAGSGVLLCALACFTVLPALLTLTDRRDLSEPATFPIRYASAWLPRLSRRPRWVLGATLAVAAVLAIFVSRVRYDYNLLHLQARGLDSVRWEMTLIDHTAGASWHALSFTDTHEQALALKARYEREPGVSRVVEVASLVPSEQNQKLPLLRDIRHRLRHLPAAGATIPHAEPNLNQVSADARNLAQALAPFTGAGGVPLLANLRLHLQEFQEKLKRTPSQQATSFVRQFEKSLTDDLAADLRRLRNVSHPQPISLADLPPGLRDRYVGKTGKWLVDVYARDCLWELPALVQFVRTVAAIDPQATGKPFVTLEGLRSLKSGFQWAGLYALVAILVIFYLDFRNWRHTLWAFAPLALGMIMSLGIMGLCGLMLNPATMIAFPLILGVGAVYGVHVVHDYLVSGTTHRYTLSFLIGRAILVMALVNIISFGTLALARHRGLAGLGSLIALGVTCCMLTALVFLPALLRLLSDRVETRAREQARRAA